jgi:hypothetical protein
MQISVFVKLEFLKYQQKHLLAIRIYMRRSSSNIFSNLRPDKFCWIQFGSGYWKFKNDQTFMCLNEILHCLTFMNRMTIPSQYDGAALQSKDLFQKSNHFYTGEVVLVRPDTQTNLSSFWRDQEHAQNIVALVMINRSTLNRRLSAPRPCALERRYHSEACFF